MKTLTFVVCVAAVVASAILPAFAGSAEPDGTDFVVTAGAGESFTNSTAIGNYARLVKRGAGEVVLTAATTAFAGEVLVAEGTLAITDLKAVGASSPVTVEDGATFWIRTPHTGAQNAPLFNTHKITISGHGVKPKGLKAFGEEHPEAKLVLVSMEDAPRKLNGIEVWPAKQFLNRLWAGKFV